MDESETVESAVKSRCKCGGILKVVKTPNGRIIKVVYDSCSLEKQG
jgi:hypothetical protein